MHKATLFFHIKWALNLVIYASFTVFGELGQFTTKIHKNWVWQVHPNTLNNHIGWMVQGYSESIPNFSTLHHLMVGGVAI